MNTSVFVATVSTLARVAGRWPVDPELLDPAAAPTVAALIRDTIAQELIPALATPEALANLRASSDYRWWETGEAAAAVDQDFLAEANQARVAAGLPLWEGIHAVLCCHRAEGDPRVEVYDRALCVAGERAADDGWLDRSALDLAPGDRNLEDAVYAAAARVHREPWERQATESYVLRKLVDELVAGLYWRVIVAALRVPDATEWRGTQDEYASWILDNTPPPSSGGLELILTEGLPGSRKTTWANRWCDGGRLGQRVRVGRDMLRDELYGRRAPHLSREEEARITQEQEARIRTALSTGKSVVVDETNLSGAGSGVAKFRRIAAELGAKFRLETRFLLVPVEECVARQAARPEREQVPGPEIYRMAARI